MRNPNDLDDHVTFCPQSNRIMDRGVEAELRTVGYLYDNLKVRLVGDYRILVNYNLQLHGSASREIDLVVINKFGVFLIEVKGWSGKIEAHDDAWIVEDTIRRENPLTSINSKARILREQFFGPKGRLAYLHDISVTGLVVLTEGSREFHNYSSADSRAILHLDRQLLHALSSTDLLFRRTRSKMLRDEEIEDIFEMLYGRHLSKRDEIIENYRVLRKMRYKDGYEGGDLAFEEYEAENVNVSTQHVRMKRYQFQKLTSSLIDMAEMVRHFKRSVEVVSALGYSPYLLNTITFFPDAKRPDVYFEVTELPTGERLDVKMDTINRSLTLQEQLGYLLPLCEALCLAHNYRDASGERHPVYHRNISPETAFIMRDGSVKLGDFDFAKFGSHTTINPLYSLNPAKRDEVFIEKPFTAPEVLDDPSNASACSDIYALGVLWYHLAVLPEHNPTLNAKQLQKVIDDQFTLPKAALALMKRMVAYKVTERPRTIEEVIEAFQQLDTQK